VVDVDAEAEHGGLVACGGWRAKKETAITNAAADEITRVDEGLQRHFVDAAPGWSLFGALLSMDAVIRDEQESPPSSAPPDDAAISKPIFISHAAEDQTAAELACSLLEERGVRCWLFSRDQIPGEHWPAQLVDSIRNSRGLLVLLSRNANQSSHIVREVQQGAEYGLPAWVIRLEDVAPADGLAYFLASTHWVDAFRITANDPMVRAIDSLVVGMQAATARKPGAGTHKSSSRLTVIRGLTLILVIAGIAAMALRSRIDEKQQSDAVLEVTARNPPTTTLHPETLPKPVTAQGSIVVQVPFADSTVTIDGDAVPTDQTTHFVYPGQHTVRVTHGRCPPWEQLVFVNPDQERVLQADICDGIGWIAIHSLSRDDRATIDGESLSDPAASPHQVTVGAHRVLVERDGHRTFQQEVNVAKRETVVVRASLVSNKSAATNLFDSLQPHFLKGASNIQLRNSLQALLSQATDFFPDLNGGEFAGASTGATYYRLKDTIIDGDPCRYFDSGQRGSLAKGKYWAYRCDLNTPNTGAASNAFRRAIDQLKGVLSPTWKFDGPRKEDNGDLFEATNRKLDDSISVFLGTNAGKAFVVITIMNGLESPCATNSDCVPAQCCHATSCVAKSAAPDCTFAMCSTDCRPGTLDCGGGDCRCAEGACRAELGR